MPVGFSIYILYMYIYIYIYLYINIYTYIIYIYIYIYRKANRHWSAIYSFFKKRIYLYQKVNGQVHKRKRRELTGRLQSALWWAGSAQPKERTYTPRDTHKHTQERTHTNTHTLYTYVYIYIYIYIYIWVYTYMGIHIFIHLVHV